MNDKKFAPESVEMNEEALEQVAGGTKAVEMTAAIPDITPAILIRADEMGYYGNPGENARML